MNLGNKIEKIEKEIKELKEEIKCNKNKDKSMTIDKIRVGEQFIYRGHNYTKLNKNNFCIVDDYDLFMCCCFDYINNEYAHSVVSHYINGRKFMQRLNLNECDLKLHFDDKLVTILYPEQFREYRKHIVDYPVGWMLRGVWRSISPHKYSNDYDILYVEDGKMHLSSIYEHMGTRVCITLKPNTFVTQK